MGITIEKAIEITQQYCNTLELSRSGLLFDALKLGIEALKRIKDIRQEYSGTREAMLPGETKEGGNW